MIDGYREESFKGILGCSLMNWIKSGRVKELYNEDSYASRLFNYMNPKG